MAKAWLLPWGIGAVAYGGASLVVPLYIVDLGGDAFDLGILAAVAAFLGVPGALLFGRLADRTGRRRAYVLVALAITCVLLLSMALVESIPLVILANGLVWFTFAAATPVLNVLAVSDTPPPGWSSRIAILNKYQGVGWAFGLFSGTIWTGIGLRLFGTTTVLRGFLVAMAIACAIGLVWGIRTFPPDPRPATVPSPRRLADAARRAPIFSVRFGTFPVVPGRFDPRDLHPRRAIVRFTPTLSIYFAAVFFAFAGFAAFFAPLPAFLVEVGYSSDSIFVFYLAAAVASAAVFEAVGPLSNRVDLPRLHAVALGCRAAAIVIVPVVGLLLGATILGFAALAGVFIAVGLTWAVIAVTAATLVTVLTPRTIQGESLGIYAGISALAGGIGSVLGGWIAAHSYPVAFVAAGALILLGAGIVLRLSRPGRVLSRVLGAAPPAAGREEAVGEERQPTTGSP